MRPGRALLFGAAAVGGLDFAYASIFVASQGRPWYRPWQSVASAVLGRASFDGGYRTVFLGILLHFIVATCIVATFAIASRFVPALRRGFLIVGPLSGAMIYVTMNFVVIPMTRIGSQPFVWSPFNIGAIVLHLVLLGPAAVYFATQDFRNVGT